jgi:hypothetical protein
MPHFPTKAPEPAALAARAASWSDFKPAIASSFVKSWVMTSSIFTLGSNMVHPAEA